MGPAIASNGSGDQPGVPSRTPAPLRRRGRSERAPRPARAAFRRAASRPPCPGGPAFAAPRGRRRRARACRSAGSGHGGDARRRTKGSPPQRGRCDGAAEPVPPGRPGKGPCLPRPLCSRTTPPSLEPADLGTRFSARQRERSYVSRTLSAGTVVSAVIALGIALPSAAHAADVGVAGSRLAITSTASTGKQSLSSTQKGAGVDFGAASAASEISGSFDVYYVDTPANRASLPLPAPWSSVDTRTAKFLNKLAPGGATGVKTASVPQGVDRQGEREEHRRPRPHGAARPERRDFCIDDRQRGRRQHASHVHALQGGPGQQDPAPLGARQQPPHADQGRADRVPDLHRRRRERPARPASTAAAAPAPPAASARAARTGSDCSSGICTNGACENPTCTGGIKDGSETDVDCGGPALPRLPDRRQGCDTGADCTSGVCTGNVCQVPSCGDGVKNGSETDVDCGGSCAALRAVHGRDRHARRTACSRSRRNVDRHRPHDRRRPGGRRPDDQRRAGRAAARAARSPPASPLNPARDLQPDQRDASRRHFDGLSRVRPRRRDRRRLDPGRRLLADGVAMRINDRGFDSIEPVATTLVDDRSRRRSCRPGPWSWRTTATRRSAASASARSTSAISGTPPPSVGRSRSRIDSQTSARRRRHLDRRTCASR